jgi:hypothetical protein
MCVTLDTKTVTTAQIMWQCQHLNWKSTNVTKYKILNNFIIIELQKLRKICFKHNFHEVRCDDVMDLPSSAEHKTDD